MKTNLLNSKQLVVEILTRAVLLLLYFIVDFVEPFRRKIQPEEEWLYKFPRTESYVTTTSLWVIVFTFPVVVILTVYLYIKDKGDLIQATLGLSLALCLNGIITNVIKVSVGRPRPDFFFRCFPDGVGSLSRPCTGPDRDVVEGLKSFPSGHSSFSFTSLGFTALYLFGKLGTFQTNKRQQAWRLVLPASLLLWAVTVAVSRTCDYHHHWQDVLAGSLLGLSVAFLCYRQYYPSLVHLYCDKPYTQLPCGLQSATGWVHSKDQDPSVKWI
ncbi:phospholipid phosphatase 5-like [Ornithodoros turicata]